MENGNCDLNDLNPITKSHYTFQKLIENRMINKFENWAAMKQQVPSRFSENIFTQPKLVWTLTYNDYNEVSMSHKEGWKTRFWIQIFCVIRVIHRCLFVHLSTIWAYELSLIFLWQKKKKSNQTRRSIEIIDQSGASLSFYGRRRDFLQVQRYWWMEEDKSSRQKICM